MTDQRRYAVYVRVDADKAQFAEQGTNIQMISCDSFALSKKYILAKDGEEDAYYGDCGSADEPKREGLRHALTDAKEGNFEILVVRSYSILGSDRLLPQLLKEFSDAGVDVVQTGDFFPHEMEDMFDFIIRISGE